MPKNQRQVEFLCYFDLPFKNSLVKRSRVKCCGSLRVDRQGIYIASSQSAVAGCPGRASIGTSEHTASSCSCVERRGSFRINCECDYGFCETAVAGSPGHASILTLKNSTASSNPGVQYGRCLRIDCNREYIEICQSTAAGSPGHASILTLKHPTTICPNVERRGSFWVDRER